MLHEKTFAFVIHRRLWKNFHQVIWLFTESRGLLPVMAYGISHFGSRRSNHLDFGNFCEIELEKRQNHWSLRHVDAIHPYHTLKKNLETSALLLSILNLLSKTLPIEMPLPKIFHLLRKTLEWLNKQVSPASLPVACSLRSPTDIRKIYARFEKALLEGLGYLPSHAPKDHRPSAANEPSRLMEIRPEHIRNHLELSEQMLELLI